MVVPAVFVERLIERDDAGGVAVVIGTYAEASSGRDRDVVGVVADGDGAAERVA